MTAMFNIPILGFTVSVMCEQIFIIQNTKRIMDSGALSALEYLELQNKLCKCQDIVTMMFLQGVVY